MRSKLKRRTSLMQEAKWRLFRLASMGPREIIFRVKEKAVSAKEWLIAKKKYPRQIPPEKIKTEDIFSQVKAKTAASCNFYLVFDKKLSLEKKINYQQCPKSGKIFPKIFYRLFNVRSTRYKTIRYLWEVNRMQFLPRLALRFKQTGNPKTLNNIIKHIRGWQEDNPYLIGANWSSTLEVGLRTIGWLFTWQILEAKKLAKKNPSFKHFLSFVWLPLIYSHMRHISTHLSRFSSANNHLIGELTALFIASSCWQFEESKKWRKGAQTQLEREICRQHTKGGVNKEEASGYALFAADLLLLAFIVGEKSGHPFSQSYRTNLKKIMGYIFTASDCLGNMPNYGDSDNATVLELENTRNTKARLVSSLMTSATIVFKDGKYKNKADHFDLKNKLYFGEKGREIFNQTKPARKLAASTAYKEEGHFFLKGSGKNSEIHLFFNAAGLGYLSIAAHGHADTLSFTLNIGGKPYFVDSGTFTYHESKKWRGYFVGTSAHNTIRTDKLDQAQFIGPTLWRKHYRCKTTKFIQTRDKTEIAAEHYGYKRLGVIHERKIIFNNHDTETEIEDYLKSTNDKKHLFEVFFHLHPKLNLARNKACKNSWFVFYPDAKKTKIELKIDPSLKVVIKRGREDNPAGWYSDRFGIKQPSCVLIGTTRKSGSFQLKHRISVRKK